MALSLPPQKYVDQLHSSVTQITRRIDIYESDASTLYRSNVGFSDASVSVDQTRDERRTLSCSLDNLDGSLKSLRSICKVSMRLTRRCRCVE